ncbi:HNH endonuclease [Rhizobium lentis]|uniref:HNH endonuclease signature motif containing protein n=1 Tax=Rhizobium lentis TaxID=1138194 RepID=UPI001C83343D|nr:HNH endonuclease signature motif containing protein [Rhizobium lentis]MBX5132534.1 HNH endonuclease [Rhizobium lentis]
MTQRSAEAQQYHSLYRTALWKQLRLAQLAHEPLCWMCDELGIVTAANTVDHRIPHKGDHALFFDAKNLASLCPSCHSRHKQRQERGGKVVRYGADGYPVG